MSDLMHILQDYTMLSRIQFAVTAIFHILWPVLTIGLGLFLVIMEALWLKTNDEQYYHHLRFWSRLFMLNFGVGVATGIPMEFQFGTNWNAFSIAGGDVFGHLLGFEGAMSFMLEATFLGIMLFGWKRVSRRMHLFATSMVCFGAFLSAFWIMAANSWMQTPTGGYMQDGKFVVVDHWYSIMNPTTLWGVLHMSTAAVQISLFVMGAISAWYLLKKRHTEFFLRSFKLAVIAAIFVTPFQIYLGDGSGKAVFRYQPTKLAAMEAHWQTNRDGQGAPWNIIAWPDVEQQKNAWEIRIPNLLSILNTHSSTGRVLGLQEFPPEDRPPIWPTFLAFRAMVFLGFGFFLLMLWTVWAWRRGRLSLDQITGQRRLLYAWIIAAPLSYLAMEAGWATREIGRQPWAIYGLLRTADSASILPPSTVGGSLTTFAVSYSVVFVVFVFFFCHIIAKGPDFKSPPPPGKA